MSGDSPSACPHPRPGGHRCKSRRCPSCGLLWAGDTRRKLLANIEHYGGDVALITVTAPGVDGVTYWHRQPDGSWVDVPDWRAHALPWGPDGRTADPAAAARWNRSAPRRWREMHRLAAQRARRRHGAFSLVAWTWEYQRRGLLHKHIVVGVATPRERAAAQTYAQELESLRERHGFGFIDRGRRRGGQHGRHLQLIPAGRAARYVAKYLSPLDAAGKPTLSDTVIRQDVPPHVTYVARSLTSSTGITMRYLRHRRLCWVRRCDPDTGETIASIIARMEGGDDTAREQLLLVYGRLEGF